LRVGIFAPRSNGEAVASKLKAEDVNADFIASSVTEAVVSGLANAPPVALRATPIHLSRNRPAARKRPVAAAS
jgi:hypothetical protein